MKKPDQDALPLGYEQPDLRDRLLAFLLGAGVTALLALTASDALAPQVWVESAVAAGLMPPETVAPGVARLVAAALFHFLGVARALTAVKLLGALGGGAAAALFYLCMREVLPSVLSLRSESRRWTLVLERLVAVAGACLLVRADPVWRLAQAWSGQLFLFVGTLFFVRLLLRLLHYGRFTTAYAALFLLGVLTAESPIGLLLSVVAGSVILVARYLAWRPDLRYLNPMLVELTKWRLSLAFLVGFAAALGADVAYFLASDGLAAGAFTYGALVVDWLVRYGEVAWQAATPLGWILAFVFVALPFGVAVTQVRRATDDDAFLHFRTGLTFAVLALVSLAPLTTFPQLRFWVWTRNTAITSPCLLALLCVALAVVAVLVLAVFFYDIWCRDHSRIALQRFPDLIEDGIFARRHLHWNWRKSITAITLACVVFVVWPGRRERASAALADVMWRTVEGTAREAAGAKVIVTDGALDAALRLIFAAQGSSCVPISMMAGRGAYARYLRTAVAANDEERAVLALGVPDAVRMWVKGPATRRAEIAFQLGFEIWRRHQVALPPPGGFAVVADNAPETRAAAIVAARDLAARAGALFRNGDYARCEDAVLCEKFLFAQWRLARLAAVRAASAEAAGTAADAQVDACLATMLDDLNPKLKDIREAVNWLRNRGGESLTPREGLRIALERADFQLARRYATPTSMPIPRSPMRISAWV